MKSTFSIFPLVLFLLHFDVYSQWTPVGPSLGVNPFDWMQFVNPSTGWTVGLNGVIRKSTDGGAHWFNQSSGVSNELMGVFFVDTARGWICGRDGVILNTTNGGAVWMKQQSGTHKLGRAMQFIDSLHGWIACDSGVVVATTNGGASWTVQSTPIATSLNFPAFISPQTGFVGAGNGWLIKTTDGGTTWTSTLIDSTLILWSIAFGDSLHGSIVASDHDYTTGTIFNSTNGGGNMDARRDDQSGHVHDPAISQ